MKKYTILLFFHVIGIACFSQTDQLPKKRMSDIWKEMITCEKDQYILNNIEIIFEIGNYEQSLEFFKSKPIIKTQVTIGDYYKPNLKVTINNKNFEGKLTQFWARNVTFEKIFSFFPGDAFIGLNFENCIFKEGLQLDPSTRSFDLAIYDCIIEDKCKIDMKSSQGSTILIVGSQFINHHNIFEIVGNNTTKVNINNSSFLSEDLDSTFIAFANMFYSIEIDSSKFMDDLCFNQVNVANTFSIKHSEFSMVSMEDFVPPPSGGVSLEWKQLALRLCLISIHWENIKVGPAEHYVMRKSPVFKADDNNELNDFSKFEKLTASYYNLLSIYKDRGDLKSANACYVEVKDLQTKMLGYEYKINPTINNYFLWQTNQFLRYFCDYGTNPAKSVIISFYVILIFGGFYFFFYSAWDRINKAYFLNRFNSLVKYLSSKTTLGEFYNLSNKREIQTYTEFKNQLKEKHNKVPGYVIFLGHLLYRYSTSKHKLLQSVLRMLDLQKGLWEDLSKGKKWLVGSIIAITIFTFVIYTIFIKALSATVLSLNAFSTLGFGNIPVKGFSKYLTVIEGFLGWLLLSIFSVSLIAQMIQ